MQTEREGVINLFIFCYVRCNFQQINIPLFFCNMRHLALLLIADGSCLMAIQKIVFFFRDGILDCNNHESVESLSYPSPPTRGLCERRKLPL